MTTHKKSRLPRSQPERITELAEFRYRLRRFLQFSETTADAAGISAQHYQLLQVIAAVPEGEASTISYIAGRMLLRHNSAVELVDRAERAELVRRLADERDLRRSLVEITERGSVLLARLVKQHLEALETDGPELVETLDAVMASKPMARRVAG
ncbi:MAG: MarR family transcriptional regulator [Edaphobacter sp.]|uniref:MarR family winged helix-turn-helix transcriptional regulator n=1 Tax=Edaphobacter sp. TaxID=1934404 RepID=UPI00239BBE67|nr:MarR family transcriptional regulator [Edaphobacter sp.]MDE1176092.1 MarR family transcriptional regulator [Edaphobacter sp.]